MDNKKPLPQINHTLGPIAHMVHRLNNGFILKSENPVLTKGSTSLFPNFINAAISKTAPLTVYQHRANCFNFSGCFFLPDFCFQ